MGTRDAGDARGTHLGTHLPSETSRAGWDHDLQDAQTAGAAAGVRYSGEEAGEEAAEARRSR